MPFNCYDAVKNTLRSFLTSTRPLATALLAALTVSLSFAQAPIRSLSIGLGNPQRLGGHGQLPGASPAAEEVDEYFHLLPNLQDKLSVRMTSDGPAALRPKKGAVLAKLRALRLGLSEESTAFVFLCGHSATLRAGSGDPQAGFICDDGLLSMSDVSKALSKGSGTVILLLDVCRDTPGEGLSPEEIISAIKAPETVVIFSTRRGRKAYIPTNYRDGFVESLKLVLSPERVPEEGNTPVNDEPAVTVGRFVADVKTLASMFSGQGAGSTQSEGVRVNKALFYVSGKSTSEYSKALNAFLKGHHNEALVLINEAEESANPAGAPKIWNLKGLILAAKGQFEEAITEYERIIGDEEAVLAYPVAHTNRIQAYVRMNEAPGAHPEADWKAVAERYYKVARPYEGGSAFYWSNRARFEEVSLQEPEKAEASYRAGIRIDATNSVLRFNASRFFVERSKVLRPAEFQRSVSLLRDAMDGFRVVINRKVEDRYPLLLTRVAATLQKEERMLSENGVAAPSDWRHLLDVVTDMPHFNEAMRDEALLTYVNLRTADFKQKIAGWLRDPAGVAAAQQAAPGGIGADDWVFAQRYYTRLAQYLNDVLPDMAAKGADWEMAATLSAGAGRLASLVRLAKQEDAAGRPMPFGGSNLGNQIDWAKFKATVYLDLTKTLARSFHDRGVLDPEQRQSPDWIFLLHESPSSDAGDHCARAWLRLASGDLGGAVDSQKLWEMQSQRKDPEFSAAIVARVARCIRGVAGSW